MSLLFSKIFKHRRLWATALVLAILVMVVPNVASAFSIFNLDDISQKAVSAVVYGITWLLALVAGVIIAILSWFLDVVLNISFGLINSAPVKIGFPIVLSMANLFFVGALIVIAIATILRRAEYGAKKVLWKLVVMAVMVNFGLVICGSLLSVSDEATKFFLQSIDPADSGPSGTSNFTGFADSLAGAFNPRGAMGLSTDEVVTNPALAQESLGFFAKTGDDFGNLIAPLVGILSTLGSFVIIIVTLTTLIAMLLWRYIRLGMALIVLPIAWAAWIFPAYQEHYKKWWTKFTQWAIFPPVAVFFVWLGLKVSEVMSDQNGEFKPLYQPEGGNAVGIFFGNLFTPVIAQTMKSFILFGIMMGGLVAAQELGIKFADAGYKAVQSTGDWAKAKAGRVVGSRVRNFGKRTVAKEGGGSTTSTALQRLGSWSQGVPGLRHIPGYQAIGQYVAKQGDTKGRYTEAIEKEQKSLQGLTDEGLLAAARISSMDPAMNAAKAQELAKRNLLDSAKIGYGDAAKGDEILKGLVQAAEKMGNDQSLYNVRPELVKFSKKVSSGVVDVLDAIKDAVKKIPSGEASNMSHASLGDAKNPGAKVSDEIAATFLNLSNSHLAELGAKGSFEQQQAVINTFEQLKKTATKPQDIDRLEAIEKHLNNNANWARSESKPSGRQATSGNQSSGGGQGGGERPPNPNH